MASLAIRCQFRFDAGVFLVMKIRRNSPEHAPASMRGQMDADVYRTVVEDLTESICRFLPDGTLTYVNEVYCRVFGKSREEVLGKAWQPVVHVDDLPIIQERLGQLTPANPVVVIENRVIDGTGRLRWMQFVNRGLYDAEGKLLETQAVGRDITPLVNAELNLDETRQRWFHAVEGSGLGVWDWDIENSSMFFSKKWKKLFGYAAHEEVEGGEQGWRELVHPDDLPVVVAAVSDHLKGRTASFTGEFRMLCKDGTAKWVLSRGRVTRRDSQGNACRMVGTTSDISKRKAAEAREVRSLQLIASGAPSEAVLDAIVKNLEAGHAGVRCTIMLVDEAEQRLRVTVAPSMPDYFKKAVDGLPLSSEGGCCGMAARDKEAVICSDLFADPAMERFNKLALKAKIRSCWSMPIIGSDSAVLGTFACYCKEPRSPNRVELDDLSNAARLAAMAVQRERQETALALSEERYALALRGTTDGLWDWNIETGETYLSPRWKAMLGFSENELPDNRQRSFLSRLHPDDIPLVQAARQAHFDGKAPYEVEFRLLNKAGEYQWFLARGRAEFDKAGKPVRMTGTISDIGARKEAEGKYLGELAFNQTLLNNTAALIAVLDLDGRFVYANPSFFSTLGYAEKEVLNRTPWDIGFMNPEDAEQSRQRFVRLLAGGQLAPMDVRLRTKTGEWRMGELRSALITKPNGEPDRIMITGIDLTERHQLQQQVLKIADLEQARLGHDLHDGVGQTMTGVVIMSEALEAQLTGESKELAGRILELLRQSVAEVRRMSHGMSPTSVKYRGLVGSLQLLSETVRTNFRTACIAELDESIVVDDPEKQNHLFRIAQEAVNNALRHGRPNEVKISLQRVDGEECEMSISNDGKRMASIAKRRAGGIGMQVMDYRANLIGGRVSVRSGSRRGVTVTCRFPAKPASGKGSAKGGRKRGGARRVQ